MGIFYLEDARTESSLQAKGFEKRMFPRVEPMVCLEKQAIFVVKEDGRDRRPTHRCR